jgi:hypothetical protein
MLRLRLVLMFGGIGMMILSNFVDVAVNFLNVDHSFAGWFLAISGLGILAKKVGYANCSECDHPVTHSGSDGEYMPEAKLIWPQKMCGNCGHDLTKAFEFK